MIVKIRFNTNFPLKSLYEWRLIVDEVEYLVNEIKIEVPCYTTSEFIEGHGQKWHITCKPNDLETQEIENKKIAILR